MRLPWQTKPRSTDTQRLLEPENEEELLRGWLIHAHKARDRHERAARTFESRRNWLGTPAIGLSAVAGTTAFASAAANESGLAIVAGGISILAAALTGMQTFLDYNGRAAANHAAGVKYKALIRELEERLTGPLEKSGIDHKWIDDLRGRLDALEGAAPVVGGNAWTGVDAAYAHVYLVGKAIELGEGSTAPARSGREVQPGSETVPA